MNLTHTFWHIISIYYYCLFLNFRGAELRSVVPENLIEMFLNFEAIYRLFDTIFRKGDLRCYPEKCLESFMYFGVIYRLLTMFCLVGVRCITSENLPKSFIRVDEFYRSFTFT